jgi:hypothetical protein
VTAAVEGTENCHEQQDAREDTFMNPGDNHKPVFLIDNHVVI